MKDKIVKASTILEIDDEFVNKVADRVYHKKEEEAKRMYTLEEVAAMPNVKVSEHTLRVHANNYAKGLTDKRQLKAKKRGKFWMVKQEDLDKYLG